MDVTAVFAACRWVHYGTLMFVFGASVLLWHVQTAPFAPAIAQACRAPLVAAVGLAWLSLLAWLPLEGAIIGDGWQAAGSWTTLAAVILHTAFGHAWVLRVVLGLATVATVWRAPRTRNGAAWSAGVSAAWLATLALSGHAAMDEGARGWLHQINHALHVLCAGAWVGALVPLPWLLRALRDPAQRAPAVRALSTLSQAGHVAVAGVLTTGVLNTALILGRLPTDPESPYQMLLAAKILLTLAMVVLAINNRYRWAPRLKEQPDRALNAIRTHTLVEIALGVGVLALVAVLGLLEPA
jgi:putative copper resistance protein D